MNRYVNTQTLEVIETVKDIDFIKRIKNWQEVIETDKTIQQLVDDGTIPTPEKQKFDGEKFVPLTMIEQLEKEIITVEEYNNDIANKRAERYKAESDPLKIEAEYDAQIAGVEPDYSEWINAVQKIKAELQYK